MLTLVIFHWESVRIAVRVGGAVDPQRLAQRIDPEEKGMGDIAADDGNRGSLFAVNDIDGAPVLEDILLVAEIGVAAALDGDAGIDAVFIDDGGDTGKRG